MENIDVVVFHGRAQMSADLFSSRLGGANFGFR